MQRRPDGLPLPATEGDHYMLAILDELRGLRADLTTRQSSPPDTLELREPEPTNVDMSVADLREQDAERLAVEAREADAGRVSMPAHMRRGRKR